MLTIEECATCPRYSAKEQRQRNRLYCVFCCEEYIEQASKNALKYNLSVSGEDFGIEAEYEHGNKVYGSGKENRWVKRQANIFTR